MDIVERLRKNSKGRVFYMEDWTDAADEIERLRKRIRRLDMAVGFMVDKFAAQEGFSPNKLHDEIDALKEKE